MNVIAVNPFAGAQADGAVAAGNPSGESTDAAGLFAALLANIVTGVSTPEGGEADAVAVSAAEHAEDVSADVDEESAEADEANSAWLPDGMVAVQPSLMAAPVVNAGPVPVTAEVSVTETSALAADAASVAAPVVETVIPVSDEVATQVAAETAAVDAAEIPVPSDGAARVKPLADAVNVAAAPTETSVDVEADAALVAAAETSRTKPVVEAKAVVESDAQPTVEALVVKAVSVAASEASKEAKPVLVEGSSKKAQLRELVAKRAAEVAASDDGSSEPTETAPASRAEKISSKPVRPVGEAVATSASFARKDAEVLEESDGAPVSATQGSEGTARPGGVTLHRESGVAGTAASATAAAPVEVPVLELPKFTESSIKQMLDSGEQRMSIRIKPDTLGEMQIEVTRSGSDVQVRLTAATQAVRDLLDTHAPQLREALAREGFDAAKVQVAPPSSSSGLNLGHAGAGQQGQHAQQQQQQQQHGGNALWGGPRFGNANAPGTASTAPARRAALAGGGASLNITV